MKKQYQEKMIIKSSPELVWRYLGDGFGKVYLYSPDVISSVAFAPPKLKDAPGDKHRVVYVPNYQFIEQLVQYDALSHSLMFEHLSGLPLSFSLVKVAIQVVALDRGTSILEWKIDLKFPFLTDLFLGRKYARTIQKHYRSQFQDLKRFLTQGRSKQPAISIDYNYNLLFGDSKNETFGIL